MSKLSTFVGSPRPYSRGIWFAFLRGFLCVCGESKAIIGVATSYDRKGAEAEHKRRVALGKMTPDFDRNWFLIRGAYYPVTDKPDLKWNDNKRAGCSKWGFYPIPVLKMTAKQFPKVVEELSGFWDTTKRMTGESVKLSREAKKVHEELLVAFNFASQVTGNHVGLLDDRIALYDRKAGSKLSKVATVLSTRKVADKAKLSKLAKKVRKLIK